MPRATLKVKSNHALVALSEAHPEAPFAVLGAWPDGEELRLLVETSAVGANSLRETLDAIPDIRGFEFQHAGPRRTRFEANTPVPEPHGAMADSGVVPSFPLHLEAGWLVGDLDASRDRLAAFRDELRSADIEFQLMRISAHPEESALLTDRQREVVDVALDLGYYETPRECTLTELAERLDVNKSVVSRVLHWAEGRIVADYRSSGGSRE